MDTMYHIEPSDTHL